MTIRTDTTGRTGDDQKRACRRWKYDKVPSRATCQERGRENGEEQRK